MQIKRNFSKILSILLTAALMAGLLTALPVSASVDGTPTQLGTSGTYWHYDTAAETLTISGTGNMPNFASAAGQPWAAFRNAIKTVVIESGVTSIGNWAFNQCGNLETATIPDSVQNIGDAVFALCAKLESIIIGTDVTSMGFSVFSGCTSLTSITFKSETPPTFGTDVFHLVPAATQISVPCMRIAAYQTALTTPNNVLETRTVIGCVLPAVCPLCDPDNIAWHNATPPAFTDGDTITIFDGARGILTVPEDTTVTITGTAKTTFTSYSGIWLDIGNNSTVIWEADYTFISPEAFNDAIAIFESGTFLMTGGKIEAVGSQPYAIVVSESARAIITGGELIATGGSAVFSFDNSTAAISTAVEITGDFELGGNSIIFTYDPDIVAIQGLRHGFTTVSQWTQLNWAVESGKSGVNFTRGGNDGFIVIPCVTVHEPAAVTNVTELEAAIAGGAKHIIINGGINITADAAIDGNGATLWVGAIGGGELFEINNGAELTLANITLVGAGEVRGVSVNNGTLIMNDGALIKNGNVNFGGGVLIADDGKLTLNGGIIKGNTATVGGNNVWQAGAAANALRTAIGNITDTDITLTQDIIWEGQLEINNGKTLNIDTNGYTLTLLNAEKNDGAVIVTDGGSLNVTGTGAVNIIKFGSGSGSVGLYVRGTDSSAAVSNVTVICSGAGSSAFGVSAYEKAQITVTGDIKAIAESYTVGAYANDSVITVGGGITVGDGSEYNDPIHVRNGAEVIIDGIITMPGNGDFIWFGPGIENFMNRDDGVPCLEKSGYLIYTDGVSSVWVKCVYKIASEADCTVCVCGETGLNKSCTSGNPCLAHPIVCQIGTTDYQSLAEALAAVGGTGTSEPTTIKLLQDITHNTQITINNRNVEIDTNGFTLTLSNTEDGEAAVDISGGGKLLMDDSGGGGINVFSYSTASGSAVTVADGFAELSSIIASGSMGGGVFAIDGSEVIVNGNIIAVSSGVYASFGSQVTVNGNVTSTGDNSVGVLASFGGEVTVTGNVEGVGNGINAIGAEVTVFGNVSSSGGFSMAVSAENAKVTVGGNVIASGDFAFGVIADSGAEVIIDGAITINAVNDAIYIAIYFDDVSVTEFEKGDGVACTVKPGYWLYTDGISSVWVKDTTYVCADECACLNCDCNCTNKNCHDCGTCEECNPPCDCGDCEKCNPVTGCPDDCDCDDCNPVTGCPDDCDCEDCNPVTGCPNDCDCEDCNPECVHVWSAWSNGSWGTRKCDNCDETESRARPSTGGGGSGSGSSDSTPSPAPSNIIQSGTSTFIVNIPQTAISAISSNIPVNQLKISATGNVNVSVGEDYAGQNAVLVRFNATTGELEFVSAAQVGANGSANMNITQTGDFLVLTFKTGDVTGTGEVQTNDALAILKHVAGTAPLNSVQLFVANGKQGDTGTTDALNILRYVAGLIDKI
jgi:hypothetical protein